MDVLDDEFVRAAGGRGFDSVVIVLDHQAFVRREAKSRNGGVINVGMRLWPADIAGLDAPLPAAPADISWKLSMA